MESFRFMRQNWFGSNTFDSNSTGEGMFTYLDRNDSDWNEEMFTYHRWSAGIFTYYWNESRPPDFSQISSVVSGCSSPTGQDTSDSLRYNEAPRMVAALREAETLFIDVRKTGLVTFNGNSTLVTLSDNKFFQHLELKKYGDGFLYNALFPEDQLSQVDLFHPLKSLNQQKP
jgi:hypothetical protein